MSRCIFFENIILKFHWNRIDRVEAIIPCRILIYLSKTVDAWKRHQTLPCNPTGIEKRAFIVYLRACNTENAGVVGEWLEDRLKRERK